ncbi:MAG: hypothetical protein ACT4TC_24810 [Myxococcaceae bacterium]
MGQPVPPRPGSEQSAAVPRNPEQAITARLDLVQRDGGSASRQQIQFFEDKRTGNVTAVMGAQGPDGLVTDVMTGSHYANQNEFENARHSMVPVDHSSSFPRGRSLDGGAALKIFATRAGSPERAAVVSQLGISGQLANILQFPDAPVCREPMGPAGIPNLVSPNSSVLTVEPNGPGNSFLTPPGTSPIKCY